MHTRQPVFVLQQGSQHRLVTEAVSQLQITCIAGNVGHIGKGLVQASMFAAQHILQLIISQPVGQPHHPVGQLDQYLACHLAMCLQPGITQAGINLVDVIEGYPAVVQAEPRSAYLSPLNLAPHAASVRHATQISVACSILTRFEL